MFKRSRTVELAVVSGSVDCPLQQKAVALTECFRCVALTGVRRSDGATTVTCAQTKPAFFVGPELERDPREDAVLKLFLARPC